MDLNTLAASLRELGIDQRLIASCLASENPQPLLDLLDEMKRNPPARSNVETPPVWKDDPNEIAAETAEIKRRFEEEKRRPPRKVDTPPRFGMIQCLRDERDKLAMAKGYALLKTYCGIDKSFSQTPLSALKLVELSDMLVNKTHKLRSFARTCVLGSKYCFSQGQYLLARIISPPHLRVGVYLAIEDLSGRAAMLSIYNLPLKGISTGPDLDALFPLGQIFAIREPVYKSAAGGDGFLLRVDSPTDVVALSPNDPLIQVFKWSFPSLAPPLPRSYDFKAAGNALFQQKKYRLAEAKYSEGILHSSNPSTTLLLHLNRSAANLLLGRFASAYRDASKVLELVDSSGGASHGASKEKALIRAAKALEGLRNFARAKEGFEKTLEHSSSNQEAIAGLERMKARLDEARTGNYDWIALFRAGLETAKEARLDVADFVGPIRVERIESRGGGRGIVATKNIAAGELLLVEKAYSMAYPSRGNKPVIVAFDLKKNVASKPSQVEVVTEVIARLLDNPSDIHRINSIYAGPPYETTPFQLGSSSPVPRLDQAPCDIDVARVEEVCSYNSLGPAGAPKAAINLEDAKKKPFDSLSALFVTASLFNHSCEPNAFWRTYGDIMVVRARLDISSGAELFIPYCSSDNVDVLARHLPAGCTCGLCTLDKLDGIERVRQRAKLVKEEYKNLSNVVLPSLRSRNVEPKTKRLVEAFITKLEATYAPSRGPLRPDLADPCHLFAELLTLSKDPSDILKAVEYDLKALEAQGGIVERIYGPGGGARRSLKKIKVRATSMGDSLLPVMALVGNVSRCRRVGRIAESRLWAEAALEMERLGSGGGREFFDVRYGDVLPERGIALLLQ